MKKLLIFMIFSVIAFGSEIDNKNSISVPVKVSAEINKLRALTEVSLVPDSGYSNFNMRTTWINRYTESDIIYLRSKTNSNLIASNITWKIEQHSNYAGNQWTINNPANYNINISPFKIPIGDLVTHGTNGAGKNEQFFLHVGFNSRADGTARTVQLQMKGQFAKTAWIQYGFTFKIFVRS